MRVVSAPLVFVVLLLAGLIGCSPSSDAATGEGEFETPDAGGEGAPNVGRCDAPVERGDETCASCDSGDICGVGDVAICESRENSAGRTCQLCVTAAGTILYNDCLDSDDVGASFCELTPGRTSDEVCRSCFDATGSVISVGCGPSADRCETNVDVDGQLCNRCYDGDTLVSTACAPADIEPRRCVAYGNDVGTCTDCYDGDDQLVLHDCRFTTGGEAAARASCETRFRDGLSCTTCVDEAGQQLSQVCRDVVPSSDRCEQLTFAEQTCVVCVDPDDVIVFVDCVDPDCAVTDTCRADADCSDDRVCFDGRCVGRTGSRGTDDGSEGNEGESEPGNEPSLGACSDPPPCYSSRNDDGALCRTCTSSAGVAETQCLSSSSLTCTAVDEAALPPSTGNFVDEVDDGSAEAPTDRPAPQGRQCVLCTDRVSGVEVYRDCAVVPPPYCTSSSAADGTSCDVCYDAVDNSLVYTRCAEEVCVAFDDVTLHDDDGVPLAVDRATAVVACQQCGENTSCALRGRCDDAFGSASPAACTAATTATTTLLVYPRRCANPWSAWRNSNDKRDDLAGLMGWALDTQQLTIAAATTSATTVPTCATRDCACARGDVVELVVSEGDVERARRAFSNLLAP